LVAVDEPVAVAENETLDVMVNGVDTVLVPSVTTMV